MHNLFLYRKDTMSYLIKGTVKVLCYAAVILAIFAAFIGIPKTAALATSASTTIGAAAGMVIGSIPDFAAGIDTGQQAMDSGTTAKKTA